MVRSLKYMLFAICLSWPLVAVAQASELSSVQRMEQVANSESAHEVVTVATEEIWALIKSGQSYVEDDPDRFYREVEALLRPVVDFPRFARSVMGPWYKKATPEQRERFSESFKWTLVRTYAAGLTEFHEGDAEILPEGRKTKNPNQALVQMAVSYREKIYTVVYAMARRDGKWSLVNVVIEGFNVRLNYRSQFNTAMKDKKYGRDMDRVIDAWSRVITAEEEA